MTLQGIAPKTIVDYTREPFVFPAGNVCVTLIIRDAVSLEDRREGAFSKYAASAVLLAVSAVFLIAGLIFAAKFKR